MDRFRAYFPAIFACLLVGLVVALVPATASAQTGGALAEEAEERTSRADRGDEDEDGDSDGDESDSDDSAPSGRARIVGGQAVAPANAPAAVKRAIAAANAIAHLPYRYGGGHAKVEDTAYDCSGAISYALIKAGLLQAPMPSGPFMRWGQPGPGKWITVYAHGGHAFVVIAGLRFDTGYRGRESALNGTRPGKGPRWGTSRPTAGFTARHPAGF